MSGEAGIWRLLLTARNEIPAAVEKNIAELNRLERKSLQTGSVLQRSMSRAGGALGVGGLVGPVPGMGIAGNLGLGMIAIATLGFRAAAKDAMDASAAAQSAADSIRRQNALSEAAVQSLNDLNLSGVNLWSGFKKVIGEVVAFLVASIREISAAGLLLNAKLGRAMGIDMGWTESMAEKIGIDFAKSAPGYMGGIGGLNEDGLEVMSKKLDEAMERRKKRAKERREPDAPRARSVSQVDDYARMGLFIGGRPDTRIATELEKHTRQLEQLNRRVENLGPSIAEHL